MNTDGIKPTIVNHGDVFKTGGDWYTFYCPECKAQLERVINQGNACQCGCLIDWNKKETKEESL